MLNSKRNTPSQKKAAAGREKPQTTLLQAMLIIITTLVLFLALLEGGLALFGIDPVLQKKDPFVGFSGNVPLFTQSRSPNGNIIYTTADNKLSHFNRQMFAAEKGANTYRIFALGGSTTYGRPYDDSTSFSGWLRELLPVAAQTRNWEVINAGGISYASYRVARLMEELTQYQPDLFIVYTGQNEFLEERTYRELKKLPEALRTTVGLLAKTRTWAATNTVLQKVGLVPEQSQPQTARLSSEVNAILDNSTGPKDYQRDDQLREGVLEHYRVSLERMADSASAAGAEIIFVTPASNLKDCSPFKSEHTASTSQADRMLVEKLLTTTQQRLDNNNAEAALRQLDQALEIDQRYAELHFLRGKALFALERYAAARQAFQQARDEDVCPLRALSSMATILAEVAEDKALPLIDFKSLIEQKLLQDKGHRIPGEELFLDHVHPTIEGHKLLAVALVEKMVAQGIVPPDNWNNAAIEKAATRVNARIDPKLQAKALINLSKVLHWAGKMEDAKRLAEQGLEKAAGDPKLTALASNVLIKIVKQQGDKEKTTQFIEQVLEVDPWSPMMHYHLGVNLLKNKQRHRGAAHILLSAAFWDNDQTNSMLGLILYKNNRLDLAYPLLAKANRQNPGDRITQVALAQLQNQLGRHAAQLPAVKIQVQRYPSGAPKKIFIQGISTTGELVPDGLLTEWREDGSLKGYANVFKGEVRGTVKQWDSNQGYEDIKI